VARPASDIGNASNCLLVYRQICILLICQVSNSSREAKFTRDSTISDIAAGRLYPYLLILVLWLVIVAQVKHWRALPEYGPWVSSVGAEDFGLSYEYYACSGADVLRNFAKCLVTCITSAKLSLLPWSLLVLNLLGDGHNFVFSLERAHLLIQRNEALSQRRLVVPALIALLSFQSTHYFIRTELGNLFTSMAVENSEKCFPLGQCYLDFQSVLHCSSPALHAWVRVSEVQLGFCARLARLRCLFRLRFAQKMTHRLQFTV